MRGTTLALSVLRGLEGISIHVPRAGYDYCAQSTAAVISYFYPRTPCGVRPMMFRKASQLSLFLSTYPVRGTTIRRFTVDSSHRVFLSTYPVRGTTASQTQLDGLQRISIHVPRAGYDDGQHQHGQQQNISIHVPRAGYDQLAD